MANGCILGITEEDQFILDDAFVASYIGRQPDWGPVGYVTYLRTYSREKEDGTREEFWETIKRVVQGVYTIQASHCRNLHLPWSWSKAQRSAQEMYKLMWNFKFLPPGRGLWMMGADYVYEKGGAALNNCGFVSTKDIDQNFADPFEFMMDMSMLGVGVGADTDGAEKVRIASPEHDLTKVHEIADSRAGWCGALVRLLKAYVGEGTLPKQWDFSKVRGYGEPIKGFGGTSSGPEPLRTMLADIKRILDGHVGQLLSSTGIIDVFNAIGKCVVAGNVRRSAQIMFSSAQDDSFLQLKDPKINKQRMMDWGWASNNSIFADVGSDYTKVAALTAVNGEPGYQWLENARNYSRMGREPDFRDLGVAGANPCVEQSLEPDELCCLVETFPARHRTYEEYERTLKFAYLYAKTVTLVPTHRPKTNAVVMRNRRIGTSQSGIIQSFNRHGRRTHFSWCDRGYNYITELDKVYSRWLCIPESVKKTSVKPSGTVSLLCGSTPGVHHPESEYYLRAIRFAKGAALVTSLREAGYRIEEDIADASAVVVYFPVKERYFHRGKRDVSMWEQLEIAAQMQKYWADNQVSVTITFKPEEAEAIPRALEMYETRLKSVSFLPLTDHQYAQAPYQAITAVEYDEYVSQVTGTSAMNTEGLESERGGKFCDSDRCVI